MMKEKTAKLVRKNCIEFRKKCSEQKADFNPA